VTKNIPVIFKTAVHIQDGPQRGPDAGALDHSAEPFDPQAVVAVVPRAWWRHGTRLADEGLRGSELVSYRAR
jgi:DNA-binding response OmpR family regulator